MLTLLSPNYENRSNSDTVRLIPKYIPIPEAKLETYIRAFIQELIYLLKHKNTPLPGLKSTITKTTLIRLAEIFNTNDANFQNKKILNNIPFPRV